MLTLHIGLIICKILWTTIGMYDTFTLGIVYVETNVLYKRIGLLFTTVGSVKTK